MTMKKTTKGAIAAATAAVLLMGGAGTLAYWGDTESITGGSITAGTLSLEATTPAAGWTLNGDALTTPLTDVRMVPGDTLVYTGTWTIAATGDNLAATVDMTGVDVSGALAAEVDVTDTYTVEGIALAPGDTITEDNDEDSLVATVTVDYDFGTTVDNDGQGLILDLSSAGVTLTQTP